MRPARIIGHTFLIAYLYITLCAFLFTVIRHDVFRIFPRQPIMYSYGMTAPYQSAVGSNGALYAECLLHDQWQSIDLAVFYPQMLGEHNIREFFAMYAYADSRDKTMELRTRYADTLSRLLAAQGIVCSGIRLSWDEWPAMIGPFDTLHIPAFTKRTLLYASDEI